MPKPLLNLQEAIADSKIFDLELESIKEVPSSTVNLSVLLKLYHNLHFFKTWTLKMHFDEKFRQ